MSKPQNTGKSEPSRSAQKGVLLDRKIHTQAADRLRRRADALEQLADLEPKEKVGARLSLITMADVARSIADLLDDVEAGWKSEAKQK